VRIWDARPYPSNQTVFLFFSDMVSMTMATADAEKKNPEYLTDKECPIVWHFTSTSIANQGRWMVAITKEWCDEMDPKRIRVVWLPLNKPGMITTYATDILEIVDIWIKMKGMGKRMHTSVRVALAKAWMPRNTTNQVKALKIHRLNLAMEVMAYYWLRARCIDLSALTMEYIKEETRSPGMTTECSWQRLTETWTATRWRSHTSRAEELGRR